MTFLAIVFLLAQTPLRTTVHFSDGSSEPFSLVPYGDWHFKPPIKRHSKLTIDATLVAADHNHLELSRLRVPPVSIKQYPGKSVRVTANGLDWTITYRPFKKTGVTWVLADAYSNGTLFSAVGYCEAPKESKIVADAIKIITSVKPAH